MSVASVSCVIPVKNGERFLAEAIESALGQTRPPAEILVVLDGCTDRSAEIAAGFGTPVRVLPTREPGPASARNTGIAEAGGDLIAFLDCDDIWLPDKLQAQVAALDAAEAVCLCGVENFWMPEVEAERLHVAETRFAGVLPGYCGSALLIPAAVFARIGVFDPNRRHTDLVSWILRAEATGIRIHILPERLVRRRRHQENLSRVSASVARSEFLDLIGDRLRSSRSSSARL